MKKNRILLVFALTFCFINSVISQVKVVPISSAKNISGNGVYYALPKTVLNIELEVEKTQNIKGPYSDFAKKYLGLSNVVNISSNDYEIKDVKISSSSIPDADQYYFVEIDEKASKISKTVLMNLSESGLIMGVNDNILKRKINKTDNNFKKGEFDYNHIFNSYLSPDVVENIDTIYTRVDVDTSSIENKIFNTVLINKSSEDKAKEIAEEILMIKENRYKLLTGFQEVAYDEGAIEYMDTQLKEIQQEYLKLFTGVKIHKTITYHFKYIPESDSKNEIIVPIFKFSEKAGVNKLSSQTGDKVNIKIVKMKNTDKLNNIVKKINSVTDSKKSRGYYYRIPDYGKVSIVFNKEQLSEIDLLINQFGIVTFLPANKSDVKFYLETGSIKNVLIEK